jgi:hypothetical protein
MLDNAINANVGCSVNDEMETDTGKEPSPPDSPLATIFVGPRSAPVRGAFPN